MRPGRPGTAAAGTLADELLELARTRERHAASLHRAICAVGSGDLFDSLAQVVEPLPLVFDVDTATIRLSDSDGRLHLVAASGCPSSEIRIRAMQPLDLHLAVRLADPPTFRRHAEALGFRWAQICWLGAWAPGRPVGSLLLASRTGRQPREGQLELLHAVTGALTDRLMTVDRSGRLVQGCAMRLARSVEPRGAGAPEGEVESLRPRERKVLNLYADGLSTSEVAALLYISPHTVRTHVKSALRTLGLHSRADAAQLVRSSLVQLL
jgi:DNA-binding CsgD family transcriptional regulator